MLIGNTVKDIRCCTEPFLPTLPRPSAHPPIVKIATDVQSGFPPYFYIDVYVSDAFVNL